MDINFDTFRVNGCYHKIPCQLLGLPLDCSNINIRDKKRSMVQFFRAYDTYSMRIQIAVDALTHSVDVYVVWPGIVRLLVITDYLGQEFSIGWWYELFSRIQKFVTQRSIYINELEKNAG